MSNEKQDLFMLLLKLKSYLVSMVEDDADDTDGLYYTEEYLDKRYPDRKEQVMNLLQEHNLKSDSEIVYNEQVHYIFMEMIEKKGKPKNLGSILEQEKINTFSPSEVEKFLETFQNNRDNTIKEMVTLLLKLTKQWSNYHEIESQVDDYIELDEKEVLRPEEEQRFESLDRSASKTLNKISSLTEEYLDLWIDFMFRFGGDIQLNKFNEKFKKLAKTVDYYYNELFIHSGLKINNEGGDREDKDSD